MASAQYIDYQTLLSPSFSPTSFSATLIRSTHHPSEPLDLPTPLSRVLFDLQDVDNQIHTLTSTSYTPLLSHVATTSTASQALLSNITSRTAALLRTHERLRTDVVQRSENATAILTATQNLHAVTSLLRQVSRALVLARQVERQVQDFHRGDWSAGVRCGYTICELTSALDGISEDVQIAASLRGHVLDPAKSAMLTRAREEISTFSLPTSTDVHIPQDKQRTTSALQILHTVSPPILLTALRAAMNAHVAASVAALTRALTSLTSLDRALAEVSLRSASVDALQGFLETAGVADNVLAGMDIDARRLTTGFWRSVAAGWEGRVRGVLAGGGSSARILRGARERLRDGVRGCVFRGLGGEFEVAVMLGALGSLGR